MVHMENIGYYAVVALAIAMPAGLIFFAASRAHRICKAHTWPKIIALGFALLYVLVALAPQAIYGTQWATAWFILTMPFSLVLEIIAPLGFGLFVFITTIIAASFWGTLLYVVFAIVLRLRRVH